MIIIFWAFLPDDDRAYAVDPMQKLCHNFQGVSKIRDAIVLADLNELCECESNTLRLAYYMIILTKCSLENTDICIKEGLNKYVDEIDLNTVSKLWDDF